MQIREAKRKDLNQLVALYDDFLAHNAGKQPEFYRAVPVEKSYPASLMKNKHAMLFVAADDAAREIAGFLHVTEEKTPPYEAYVPYQYATVVDVYVAPQHRGKGVGRALIESARNWAISRELGYLELMVLEEDLGARTFSRQLGFNEAYRVMRSPAVPMVTVEQPQEAAAAPEPMPPAPAAAAPQQAPKPKDPMLEDTHEFSL